MHVVALLGLQYRIHLTRPHPQSRSVPCPERADDAVCSRDRACSSPNPRRDRVQRPSRQARRVSTPLSPSCRPKKWDSALLRGTHLQLPCPALPCPVPCFLFLFLLLPTYCTCRCRPCCPLPSRLPARANFWSTASQGHLGATVTDHDHPCSSATRIFSHLEIPEPLQGSLYSPKTKLSSQTRPRLSTATTTRQF